MAKRRRKCTVLNLSQAITEILKEYGDEVYAVTAECIDEVSDGAVNRLRAVNHFRRDGTGAYAGGWVNETLDSKPLTVSHVIHNAQHYRLTHLLEKGHVVRDGKGREVGHAAAYPHIKPVNDWANEELVRLVKRRIEG